ncbi:unnamed protein product [Schistosoma mattheei]|uniref:Uncharacterized protein n=1 Tax=Schistosoma mattheei TaxID=31246 RepID=A0A183PBX0_9TREM|nr:unnamed protein product [Schistosoma mattheei]
MLPPNTNTQAVFLKPRAPFKLAAFSVRTLVQIGQKIGLSMSLKSLNIDVFCLSETRIQDSSEVLQIRSPSIASKGLFYVRLSGDPVASSSGYLRCRRDIRLLTQGRVYCAAVRSVLLYGSETWPVRVEDIRRLLVFDHRCLRSIAPIS